MASGYCVLGGVSSSPHVVYDIAEKWQKDTCVGSLAYGRTSSVCTGSLTKTKSRQGSSCTYDQPCFSLLRHVV